MSQNPRLTTRLLAIYDNNDNLKQRFEYANQRIPVAMTQDNQKYYLHYDQVGSLRAISDTNHNIIKEITYDTFGNILSNTNPSFKIPFGFAGGLYDRDTKLTRFGYRDYDAKTGKWTAKDPIGFDGGDSNLYGYVLGDPVSGIDPSGLVDLNLFEPGSYDYGIANGHGHFNPGYTVGGHGAVPYDQSSKPFKDLEPWDLAKKMRENGYEGGSVSLLICNSGTSYDGEPSEAQKLARELGSTVYAPTSYYVYKGLGVYYTTDGKGLTPFFPWN